MRAFIAVEVPEAIRRKITETIDTFRSNQPVKWVETQNLHITLKFLGEVPDEKVERVIELVEQLKVDFKPFEVSLANFGCFPDKKNPRVLWVGVKSGAEELIKIEQRLESALAQEGFEIEKRFHPHLTVGRTKARCEVAVVLGKPFSSEPFTVKGLTLFKSTLTPQGPVYEAVRTLSF